MSFLRMIAVGGVYLLACGGWMVLGTTTVMRAEQFSALLGGDVVELWGGPVIQDAPELSVEIPGTGRVRKIRPAFNQIDVKLALEHRRRGLVWYPTFVSDFAGTYTVANTEKVTQKVRVHFKFPTSEGTYDNFSFVVDGKSSDVPVNTAEGLHEVIEVPPGESREFKVTYRTRGMREWRYRPASNVGRVQGLKLGLTTNFREVDFPEGSLSPTTPEEERSTPDGGAHVKWEARDLITTQDIGMVMPERLNPGPLSARMTFFAPVCLFFFFLLVAVINIVTRVKIHPMHYLFVAAGFFAFHLLFAYMVDHVNVHVSFAASSIVAVLLVTGYLYAALKGRFPWKIAAGGQLFYLVLFSYTFFLQGLTGLTVTVGSILTLGVLMWVTARIDWFDFFGGKPGALPAPPPPQARKVSESTA